MTTPALKAAKRTRRRKSKPSRSKPYAYVVSCPRIPAGRYYRTLTAAKKEMNRQMRTGATSSGISEVWTKKEAERGLARTKKRRK